MFLIAPIEYKFLLPFICLLLFLGGEWLQEIYLHRIIVVPLGSITDTAQKLANLDFMTVCDIQSNDELCSLSNSLNTLASNLQNALDTWNSKLAEIWQILTQSPETFKGGGIWQVIVQIHGALQAIGYALLVLFFVVGVVKTCGSFTEVKRPEHALKIFIRFAIAKGVVTYGLELMMALFNIIQGVTSTIMQTAGFGSTEDTVLPDEIIEAVEDCGFFESIPLWAVT